ncbi:MAG: redoxin domain-containing protein [Bacteroidetes bacterium]|nr:redoxin domain-containing protein [Bacteroidota bacterium]
MPLSKKWPQADSTLAGLPIYTTFDEIAPLFEQDNDTTYVINFWATWCKPCVKELPYFEALNTSLQGQKAKVILVSLDFPKKVKSSLIPFVEKHQLQSEVLVLLDGKYNDWIDRVDPKWTGAIPATLIYKGQHRRFIGEAVEDTNELQAAVEEIARR